MKRRKKRSRAHRAGVEKKASHELRELCQDAYHEQQSHNPKAALAFAGLGQLVPKLANAVPGWSHGGLTRSMFDKQHRKGLH